MTASLDRTDIASVVTDVYLLDFLILYESLVESWTASPFVLHAFALEDDVVQLLSGLALEGVEVHRLPGEAGDWRRNAARKLDLVGHSGLERCIVSDADNVFLAAVPELALMLADHDLLFVAGSSPDRPVQTALWSFRRSERSIEFAHEWNARSEGTDPPSTSIVLGGLAGGRDYGDAVAVVRTPGSGPGAAVSPYGVDADLPGVSFQRDWLGFLEERAGRVKVVHLAGLRGEGRDSLAERIDVLVERFPRLAPVLPYYLSLAERASARLGVDDVANPMKHARSRLLDAGIPGTRHELPDLLNRRGLEGKGFEIGVRRGIFSEVLLRSWRCRTLISVDPWLEAPSDEYMDASNVGQAEHERFYQETVKRLEKFGDRSEIWRMTSLDAAARVAPQSLDFVYLDARHDYESVKEDLTHWLPKIRPGGVFAGHDYADGLRREGLFGVKSAVDEFFGERGLRVEQTYVEPGTTAGPPRSWVVEIPASASA